MRLKLSQVPNFWIDHPSVDWIAILGIIGLDHYTRWLEAPPADQTATWLQTLAATAGLMLTVGTLVITLVLTVTPTPRLRFVLTQLGSRFHRITMSSLGGLALAMIVFTSMFWLESSKLLKTHLDTLAIAFASLAVLRFLRLWWILSMIFKALTSRHVEDQNPAEWEPPTISADDYELPKREVTI